MKTTKKIMLVLLCISTIFYIGCSTLQKTKKQAEAGDAASQFYLGLMYATGDGVNKDSRQAVNWWKKSAQQGNSEAQNALGIMYQYGDGVEQDYKQAVYWYAKAAEQEHAYAQNNLASMYYTGNGITQDYKKALLWYIKSAKKNNPLAQNNLGLMYENGTGVEQNYTQAFYWYSKAVQQGDADAKEALNHIQNKLPKYPVKLGEKVYKKVHKDGKIISKWVECTEIAELDKRGNEIYTTYNYKTDNDEIQNREIYSFFNDKGDIFFRDVDGLQMWIDLKYDETGNLIYLKQHNNWINKASYSTSLGDKNGNFIIATGNKDGQEVWYEYDNKGKRTYRKGNPTFICFEGEYIYDKNGNLIAFNGIDGACGSIWKYDVKGNNTYYYSALYGDEYWYQYNKKGNIVYCIEKSYDRNLKMKTTKEFFYEYIDIPNGKLRIEYSPY